MELWGLTHYISECEGKHFAFELGKCENCGGDVQEPNPINIVESERKMKHFGLKKWEGSLPPEIFYDEEKGCCVCEECE
jgi:hypothetical protein